MPPSPSQQYPQSAIVRAHHAWSTAWNSHVGAADNANFIEHFRYTIVASQLLNEYLDHGSGNPATAATPSFGLDGPSDQSSNPTASASLYGAAYVNEGKGIYTSRTGKLRTGETSVRGNRSSNRSGIRKVFFTLRRLLARRIGKPLIMEGNFAGSCNVLCSDRTSYSTWLLTYLNKTLNQLEPEGIPLQTPQSDYQCANNI